ncbi:MAG: cation-translocating P-type ATPase [Mycoplasmataceae bacterium]|nr:cation-translocating P-type ATPase [Mycoplasmataceae bacterium]
MDNQNQTLILTELQETSSSLKKFLIDHEVEPSVGLTSKQVLENREKFGVNKLNEAKKVSFWKLLVHQFKDLLNVMLTIIAIIDFVTLPFIGEAGMDHMIQGIVILAIVIVNVGLSIFQESKASSALEALKNTASPSAKVMRDGKITIIPTTELVVGDIVYLEDGVIVPADLRLIETNSLKIEEAALTGESLPIEKNALKEIKENAALGDRVDSAFSSTIVTYGSGVGVVSAVGMKTEMGKIASLLTDNKEEEVSPLKKKINSLTKTLTIFAFSLLVIMIVLNVSFYALKYSGISGVNFQYWSNLNTIINIVALAISLVPVALPVTTTVVLSMSVKAMAKKNALCKSLTIVETIGNATVICSDKTGTLTMNKMSVVSVNDYEDIFNSTPKKIEEVKNDFKRYKHLVSICMFCNNADINFANNNSEIGDPTEIALLYLGKETDLDVTKTRDKYKRVFEQPFDSDRKRMTTVYKTKNGYTSFTKGAAESMLDLCDKIQTKDGIRPITFEDKELIKTYLEKLSANALRVLGLASRNFIEEPIKDANYETGMTFKGLVGMIDPPRKEVYDAVATCHKAGVNIAMITGDHQITALAIAKELGIVNAEDNKTLTGVEIDSMSDEQLKKIVNSCHVYARVSPDNKLRIVKAFKANNEIAGMTGDGTNDAPALKVADIGIAMGKSGTDVAKGAANILLLDDNFSTIKSAINDGRKITRNIKNVISFIMSTNLATALFILLFTYIFAMDPLIVTQRLLLDLVTDTLPCIFIGLNSNDFGLMLQAPNRSNKLFDKQMIKDIIYNTLFIFISVSAAFLISWYAFGISGNGGTNFEWNSINLICFVTLSLSRILLSFSYVSSTNSIFSKGGKIYKELYFAVFASIILLMIFVLIPGLNEVVKAPDIKSWNPIVLLPILLLPLISIFGNELRKIVFNLIKKNKNIL